MAAFSIVHASDLHFGAEKNRVPSPFEDPIGWRNELVEKVFTGDMKDFRWFRPATHDEAVFERFADKLTQIEAVEGIDLLVLSGDVATTGHDKDLGEAWAAITSPFDAKQPYLTVAKVPTLSAFEDVLVVMPGNHDRFHPLTLLPGNKAFDAVFNKFWPAARSRTGRVVSSPLRFLDDNGVPTDDQIEVISADFALRTVDDQEGGPMNFLSQGRAYKDIADELADVTSDAMARRPKPCPIWVIHFPPKWPNCNERAKLIDEANVIDAAQRLGVPLVLSGHHHEADKYSLTDDSVTQVLAAGTTTQRTRHGVNAFWHLSVDVVNGSFVSGGAKLYKRLNGQGEFAIMDSVSLW